MKPATRANSCAYRNSPFERPSQAPTSPFAPHDLEICLRTPEVEQHAERLFVERFHRELRDGAADEILTSLRAQFDAATKVLADATSMVDINTDPAQLANTGSPEEIAAYRALRPAVAELDKISVIARSFGPSGDFPLIDQPPIIDCFAIREGDIPLLCTGTDLVRACSAFRARTADIRTSPWLRTTPRLNTIDAARERLRAWAEAEWEIFNGNQSGRGHFDENGNLIPEVRRNPFAVKETAKVR